MDVEKQFTTSGDSVCFRHQPRRARVPKPLRFRPLEVPRPGGEVQEGREPLLFRRGKKKVLKNRHCERQLHFIDSVLFVLGRCPGETLGSAEVFLFLTSIIQEFKIRWE